MSLFGPIAGEPIASVPAPAVSTPAAPPSPPTNFQAGPRIPGAPWAYGPPRYNPDSLPAVFVPPVAPPVASNTLFTAPPVPGAPWNVLMKRLGTDDVLAPPAPPVTQFALSENHVVVGPPIPGSPWRAQILLLSNTGAISPPGPIPPTPTSARAFPFLPRVPDTEGPAAEDRRRRFTELMSICFNSLVRKGELVQTGPTDFDIFAKGFANTGLTGTFNMGPFSGPAGMPGPGLTGTFSMGPFP